jgi:hypothetical protein
MLKRLPAARELCHLLAESFEHFDLGGRGYVGAAELHEGLARLGIGAAPPVAAALAALVASRGGGARRRTAWAAIAGAESTRGGDGAMPGGGGGGGDRLGSDPFFRAVDLEAFWQGPLRSGHGAGEDDDEVRLSICSCCMWVLTDRVVWSLH